MTFDEVRCETGCLVLTRGEAQRLRLIARCRDAADPDARFASLVRRVVAWHDWAAHYLAIPDGLTDREFRLHLKRIKRATNRRRVFRRQRELWWRRRPASRRATPVTDRRPAYTGPGLLEEAIADL